MGDFAAGQCHLCRELGKCILSNCSDSASAEKLAIDNHT